MSQPSDSDKHNKAVLGSELTPEFTTLGKIGAAHGIKGWVRLISYTDPADNILNYRHFFLTEKTIPGSQAAIETKELESKLESKIESKIEREQIEIDESRAQGKHFVGHIKGCGDREQAGVFTGRELQVKTSVLPALDTEEYYWFELVGLAVINLQGEILGLVDHLMETGANDVLVVRASEESIDSEERLIPFVRDKVVKRIDLKGGALQVDWEKDY
jgi:16S rRNA processing protein RimM